MRPDRAWTGAWIRDVVIATWLARSHERSRQTTQAFRSGAVSKSGPCRRKKILDTSTRTGSTPESSSNGEAIQAAVVTPLLSVLIPVYNERTTVLQVLERVLRVPLDLDVIVVDDGSSDGTRELLQAYRHDRVRICYHERNQGKGMAVRTALQNARGQIVVVQDADLEYRPEEFVQLVEPIVEGRVKVVYGSRCLNPENEMTFDRFRFGSWVLTRLTNLLYRARLTDEPTCYKLFHQDVIRDIPLRCTGFEFCPEITAKVLKRGHEILELPISYQGRTVAEGKKINWKDGVIGIWTLLKYRFVD
jgi:glycosyltransferase involved in cell wall biosynthesis